MSRAQSASRIFFPWRCGNDEFGRRNQTEGAVMNPTTTSGFRVGDHHDAAAFAHRGNSADHHVSCDGRRSLQKVITAPIRSHDSGEGHLRGKCDDTLGKRSITLDGGGTAAITGLDSTQPRPGESQRHHGQGLRLQEGGADSLHPRWNGAHRRQHRSRLGAFTGRRQSIELCRNREQYHSKPFTGRHRCRGDLIMLSLDL